jgi:hypothetical protein
MKDACKEVGLVGASHSARPMFTLLEIGIRDAQLLGDIFFEAQTFFNPTVETAHF